MIHVQNDCDEYGRDDNADDSNVSSYKVCHARCHEMMAGNIRRKVGDDSFPQ